MLKGCGISILVCVATYFWVKDLIQGTPLSDYTWIPIIFAFGMLPFVGNVWGILIASSQRKSLGKLVDGEVCGVSGRISSKGSPAETPFSKKPAVYLEYKATTIVGSGKNRQELGYSGLKASKENYITGFQGTVYLKGFPFLTQVSPSVLRDEASYNNAEEFLNSVSIDSGIPIREIQKLMEAESPEYHASRGEPSFNRSYQLTETIIPNGAEVTAFGTYHRETNTLDISASSLSHSIQLGKGDEVVSKALSKSIYMTLFFGAQLAIMFVVLFELIGVDVLSPYCLECKDLIETYIRPLLK